ncbi:MAG: hypothetical protein AB8W37_00455 [Arsenophonus endosymbiont of Dermacentor nuttalli]
MLYCDHSDITDACSLAVFYENVLGFELAVGWAKAVGEKNQAGKKPQDSMFALGGKYIFADKTVSIGVDYGRLQSTNVLVAGKTLTPTSVTGDWVAHLYSITLLSGIGHYKIPVYMQGMDSVLEIKNF